MKFEEHFIEAPSKQSGFTVFELLVGIVILSLIGRIAAVNLREMQLSINRYDIRQQLEFDIKFARSHSMAKGVRGILTVTDSGASYSFGYDRPPYNDPPAYDTVDIVRRMPVNITVSIGEPIVFDSRGMLIDDLGAIATGSITIEQGSTPFETIVLHPSGALSYNGGWR